MPKGIPKDPNWKPRKQPYDHPFRRRLAPSEIKDTDGVYTPITESDFSDYTR